MTCNSLDRNGERVDIKPDKLVCLSKGIFLDRNLSSAQLIEISNHPLLISLVVQLALFIFVAAFTRICHIYT